MSGPITEQALLERAAYLKTLERGWDSYQGEPIDHPTLDKAVAFALLLAPEISSYTPALVPCSDGSVQVEWHAEGWDVELWVQRA